MIARLHESLAARLAARKDGEDGFTLIELLVVVLIIGILAAIAIPIFLGQQNSAKDSSAASDASNAALAESGYFAAQGKYSTDTTALKPYGFSSTSGVTMSAITVDNTTTPTAFCLTTSATSGHTYAISNAAGLTKGGTCAAGVLTAPSTPATW